MALDGVFIIYYAMKYIANYQLLYMFLHYYLVV